ncbi:hypothetical protein NA56DRAFT_700906 [Hyaloscypha hepaticicola]|uniref:Uncharacterized protein n=1 Tax=Hyaloscypha hepaticicola TaxID=2082293 RepID=A0A2J6QBA5_9HELO|nr:hypothetical protein NA56DRAFT_700906 [Hyaloscypha hepaticicola]
MDPNCPDLYERYQIWSEIVDEPIAIFQACTQLESARVDEAYLELSASAIDDIRHDSNFKFFYPTYFIVQVRHAASFDHVFYPDDTAPLNTSYSTRLYPADSTTLDGVSSTQSFDSTAGTSCFFCFFSLKAPLNHCCGCCACFCLLLANFSSFSRCFSLTGFTCVHAILNGYTRAKGEDDSSAAGARGEGRTLVW